jgi:DNA-directed RNA polymerase subunit E'/Rpb7
MRVQLFHDSEGCIGLLLDYEKHSQIVGNFRYDKDVSRYFQRPQSISLSHGQHLSTRCTDVKFSSQSTPLDTAIESGMQPMRGIIVWWYSTKT